MKNVFASTIVAIGVLLVLCVSVIRVRAQSQQIRTVYIGFSSSPDKSESAYIGPVSKTLLFGVEPPLMPVCVLETHDVRVERVSTLPVINMQLWSRVDESRRINVQLIDAIDKESTRTYWFFPDQNPQESMPDVTKEILDDDDGLLESLPDGMGDEFREKMNRIHRIGDAIEESRRDHMISLSIEALRDSEFAWAGEMLEQRQSSITNRQQSSFGPLLIYFAVSLLLALIAGVLTWLKIIQ